MSALLRFVAALVAVSFVTACGETLPTGVDQADGPAPFMAADDTSDDGDDGDDGDDDDDDDGDVGTQGGWMGSGG